VSMYSSLVIRSSGHLSSNLFEFILFFGDCLFSSKRKKDTSASVFNRPSVGVPFDGRSRMENSV
jgi:hypothetical protein